MTILSTFDQWGSLIVASFMAIGIVIAAGYDIWIWFKKKTLKKEDSMPSKKELNDKRIEEFLKRRQEIQKTKH